MPEKATHCQRSACKKLLKEVRWRIWNNPTTDPPYRDYCLTCGNKIIKANRDFADRNPKTKLRHEVLMPFSQAPYGARFIYEADEHPIPKVWIVLNNAEFGSIAEYSPSHIFHPNWSGQMVLAAKVNLDDDPIVRVIG